MKVNKRIMHKVPTKNKKSLIDSLFFRILNLDMSINAVIHSVKIIIGVDNASVIRNLCFISKV